MISGRAFSTRLRLTAVPPAALVASLLFPSAAGAVHSYLPNVVSATAAGSFLRADDYRVANIVYRLGVAGRWLCAEQLPLTGLLFHHLAEYESRDRPEAIRRYALNRGVGVLAVVPGSPAAAAGIRAGDVLVAVNGRRFPSPVEIAALAEREQWWPRLVQTEVLIEEQLGSGGAALALLRDGRELNVSITPIMACPARSRLARSRQPDAFADGRYAIMTTRFLRFFRSDDELAVAMAHEVAHNILRHPQQLEAQGVPYGPLRHAGRNRELVRATEEEADRLSIRLLWAAGFDLSIVIPFWRRLHSPLDRWLQIGRSHTSFEERERRLRHAMSELPAAPARPVE